MTVIKAYPEGEERAVINAVFDEVLVQLKQMHYLTHEDHVQEEQPAAVPAVSDVVDPLLCPDL